MAATYTTTHLTTSTNHVVATATSTIVAALQAPSGYVVDFDNPTRKGDTTGYWVFAVGMTVAFLFLCMRLYTKVVIVRSFAVDDICIVLSWVLGMGCQSILVWMWRNKVQGVHAWEIPLEDYNLYNLLIMCASVLYSPTQGFAKLSLLFFYRRMAPHRWFHIAIYLVMFVVASYTLGIIFSLIFPCKPIAANWDVTITGKCINKAGVYIATAVINIATDIAILVLPIPILARLEMPLLEKLALIGMFAVGSMTCITSVVRLVLLIPMLTDFDQTWVVSIPCVWILVEANLVVICGCLPVVRKFARHVAPRMFSDAKSSGSTSYQRKSFDFQTIGSKPSRPFGKKGKSGLTYSNIELDTTYANEHNGGELGDSSNDHDSRRHSSSKGGTWSDGGSETHIVGTDTQIIETRTTTVEYEERTESIRNGRAYAIPRGI